MPTLTDILTQLQGQAQPRPDLVTPGQTGALENARPYTMAGRVGYAGKPTSVAQIMTRLPQESPDAEGLGGAVAAGLVPPGVKTLTPLKSVTEQLSQNSPMLKLTPTAKLDPALYKSLADSAAGFVGGSNQKLQGHGMEILSILDSYMTSGENPLAVDAVKHLSGVMGLNTFKKLIRDAGYSGIDYAGGPKPRILPVGTFSDLKPIADFTPEMLLKRAAGTAEDTTAQTKIMLKDISRRAEEKLLNQDTRNLERQLPPQTTKNILSGFPVDPAATGNELIQAYNNALADYIAKKGKK